MASKIGPPVYISPSEMGLSIATIYWNSHAIIGEREITTQVVSKFFNDACDQFFTNGSPPLNPVYLNRVKESFCDASISFFNKAEEKTASVAAGVLTPIQSFDPESYTECSDLKLGEEASTYYCNINRDQNYLKFRDLSIEEHFTLMVKNNPLIEKFYRNSVEKKKDTAAYNAFKDSFTINLARHLLKTYFAIITNSFKLAPKDSSSCNAYGSAFASAFFEFALIIDPTLNQKKGEVLFNTAIKFDTINDLWQKARPNINNIPSFKNGFLLTINILKAGQKSTPLMAQCEKSPEQIAKEIEDLFPEEKTKKRDPSPKKPKVKKEPTPKPPIVQIVQKQEVQKQEVQIPPQVLPMVVQNDPPKEKKKKPAGMTIEKFNKLVDSHERKEKLQEIVRQESLKLNRMTQYFNRQNESEQSALKDKLDLQKSLLVAMEQALSQAFPTTLEPLTDQNPPLPDAAAAFSAPAVISLPLISVNESLPEGLVELLQEAKGEVTYLLDSKIQHALIICNLKDQNKNPVDFSVPYTPKQIELIRICAIHKLHSRQTLPQSSEDLNAVYHTILQLLPDRTEEFSFGNIVFRLQTLTIATYQVLSHAGIQFTRPFA